MSLPLFVRPAASVIGMCFIGEKLKTATDFPGLCQLAVIGEPSGQGIMVSVYLK